MMKTPNNKGQKKNLFLGLFTFLFFVHLAANDRPETTTKPDKQIPGIILSL